MSQNLHYIITISNEVLYPVIFYHEVQSTMPRHGDRSTNGLERYSSDLAHALFLIKVQGLMALIFGENEGKTVRAHINVRNSGGLWPLQVVN